MQRVIKYNMQRVIDIFLDHINKEIIRKLKKNNQKLCKSFPSLKFGLNLFGPNNITMPSLSKTLKPSITYSSDAFSPMSSFLSISGFIDSIVEVFLNRLAFAFKI